MTLHCSASVVLVAVQALQKPKLKICEQAPAFNFRLLHLRCATAALLGLIAALYLHYFDDKMEQGMGVVQFGKLLSLGSSLMTLHCFASAISVALQALQKPKMKICEQAPAFNFRLLHLRCATAAPVGLIAAWYLHYFDDKMVQTMSGILVELVFILNFLS